VYACGADVYCFLRAADAEVADCMPGLKLGAAQLAGFFAVDTAAQFDAADEGTIERALRATRPPVGVDVLTALVGKPTAVDESWT